MKPRSAPATTDPGPVEDAEEFLPFAHIYGIWNPVSAPLRPGTVVPPERRLGALDFFDPYMNALAAGAAEANRQMLERAGRLVIVPVPVARLGIGRMVYLVVAAEEAEQKGRAFAHWANHAPIGNPEAPQLIYHTEFWREFFAGLFGFTLGWWAPGFLAVWALTELDAERIIQVGFRQPR